MYFFPISKLPTSLLVFFVDESACDELEELLTTELELVVAKLALLFFVDELLLDSFLLVLLSVTFDECALVLLLELFEPLLAQAANDKVQRQTKIVLTIFFTLLIPPKILWSKQHHRPIKYMLVT